jgi:hypothetical protein
MNGLTISFLCIYTCIQEIFYSNFSEMTSRDSLVLFSLYPIFLKIESETYEIISLFVSLSDSF